nr:hypothetical protein [Tanacetum cinerariifolium]
MENTMFELVKICQEKEFLCIHDDVDNLIESALDSKLLLINSNSQRIDKKEQEVKNVVEQPTERGNRSIQSLQNFRVVHKSSISFKNTSQISSIHSVAPIQSTKEPEHLLSMWYEHPSITPETESDEVTESNAENLLPIPSKCEVTLEDEIECDMPSKDVCSPVFTTFSNPLFKDNDDLDSSDEESLPDEDVPAEEFKIYSNPLCDEDEINSDNLDPHCFNVESDFVESLLNRDTFIDFSSEFDFSGELAHIKPEIPKSNFEEEIRLIENLLYDNSFPRPSKELNAEITDTIIESIPLLPIPVQDGNSQQEEIDIVTKTDDVLPSSDENDDDLSNDFHLGEADLFLSNNSMPPGIENVADDPEGDIRFLEELLIDDSILSHELSDANFKENPSIPRPPPESPDDNFNLEPECHPMDQNIDFSDSDQIQTPQFPDIHPPSQEISDEVFQAKGNLMKFIQFFLEEFNYIPFGEKPKILLQAWDKFFTIRHAQPEDSNELFQKLLEDLKELAEYKESLQNSSEIATSNSNQEKEGPPQDFGIHQLIREECCIEVCEEQKKNMENTMLDALNFKLLLINYQRLDKKEQEVKNVVEQPAERKTRIVESLQNFRVIRKSSTSLKDTSQISLVHAIAPILSTKEPEYSPSMGDDDMSSDDDDFEDIKYVEASFPDPEIVSVEEENVVQHEEEEEEVDLEDISQIQDVVLREKLLSINRLIANIKSLNDNPTPDCVLNSFTRNGSTTTHADDSFLEYDSFCFEIEPDQKRLVNVVKNDISDDSSNDPLLEEANLFLASDNSIP